MISSDRSLKTGKDEVSYIETKKVVLQLPNQTENKCILYCPAYLRIKIQRLKDMQLEKLNAEIKIYVKFDVDVTDLPEGIVQLIKQELQLSFLEQQESISLKECNSKDRWEGEKKQRRMIGYRFRKSVIARIIPHVFWTPFEILNLVISVEALSIQIWEEQKKRDCLEYLSKNLNKSSEYLPDVFSIKFNFMDFEHCTWYVDEETNELLDGQIKLMYGKTNSFGQYDLAEAMLRVEYTNKEFCQKQQKQEKKTNSKEKKFTWFYDSTQKRLNNKQYEQNTYIPQYFKNKKQLQKHLSIDKNKILPFNYAHFDIPICRIPIFSFFTIFLYIWILGIISLLIFFSDPSLLDRIASITTIILAHIAFMPSIRQKIPPRPNITFIQYLIYAEIFVMMLALLDSFASKDTELGDFDQKSNAPFLISFIVQIITTIIFFVLIIVHKLLWEPNYRINKGINIKFEVEEWENTKCKRYFRDKISEVNLQIVQFPQINVRKSAFQRKHD